jgi:hypothetical protein
MAAALSSWRFLENLPLLREKPEPRKVSGFPTTARLVFRQQVVDNFLPVNLRQMGIG